MKCPRRDVLFSVDKILIVIKTVHRLWRCSKIKKSYFLLVYMTIFEHIMTISKYLNSEFYWKSFEITLSLLKIIVIKIQKVHNYFYNLNKKQSQNSVPFNLSLGEALNIADGNLEVPVLLFSLS